MFKTHCLRAPGRRFAAPLLALATLNASASAAPRPLARGSQVPAFTTSRWIHGAPVRLADLKDRVVLLAFIGSGELHAEYAKALVEALRTLRTNFSPEDLSVIGVMTVSTLEGAMEFLKENPVDFPVAFDGLETRPFEKDRAFDASETLQRFGFGEWPAFLFVQPGGRVALSMAGIQNAAQLEKVVRAILGRGQYRTELARTLTKYGEAGSVPLRSLRYLAKVGQFPIQVVALDLEAAAGG